MTVVFLLGVGFSTALAWSFTGGSATFISPNEHSHWPMTDRALAYFYVQDIGHPALIHNLLLITGSAIGGLPLMRLIHVLGGGLIALLVGWTSRKSGHHPLLAFLASFAVLDPQFLSRIIEIRPYLTEVVTAILAAGVALGPLTRQRDKWMVFWAGLLTLDNPLALPFFVGLCLFRAHERRRLGEASPLVVAAVLMTVGVAPAAFMASTEHLANSTGGPGALSLHHGLWIAGTVAAGVAAPAGRSRALAVACLCGVIGAHLVIGLGIIRGEPKLFTYLIAPTMLLAADAYQGARAKPTAALAAVAVWLTAWLPWGMGLLLTVEATFRPKSEAGRWHPRLLLAVGLVTLAVRGWSLADSKDQLNEAREHDLAWSRWIAAQPEGSIQIADGSTSPVISALSMDRKLVQMGRLVHPKEQTPASLTTDVPSCTTKEWTLYAGRGYATAAPHGCDCAANGDGPVNLSSTRFQLKKCVPQGSGG